MKYLSKLGQPLCELAFKLSNNTINIDKTIVFDLADPRSGVIYDPEVGRFSTKSGFSREVIEYVSWFGALLYCRYMGQRLLTEAEYEYAASKCERSPHDIFLRFNARDLLALQLIDIA